MEEKLQAEYVEKMKKCVKNGDTEAAHRDADNLLCELLLELGCDELVETYRKVHKWYE